MLLSTIQMFSSPLLPPPPTLCYPQPHHPNSTSNVPHPFSSKFPSQKSFGCHRMSMCASSPDSSLSLNLLGEGFDADLGRLLVLLPDEMRLRICVHRELNQLVELVLDLGRPPLARFPSGDFVLSDSPVTFQEIEFAACQVGDFAVDNRAGISRTLHRISAIRNRKGAIIGLTCRVGRVISGSANLLRDLVQHGASLLLIGPPGVGKTTIIREIARILSNDYKKRVMIVDTSNEIGGDGDIPHPGIGTARRMQVPNSDMQHKVLIEAIENHMPEVIVIDEIGTQLEAMAARTIAQRGIQLVATAHGIKIENLIMNPSLDMLVGGIQSVILGDDEASRRGKQKTVLERKGPSTFSSGIEIVSKAELRVHHSLEATVDAILSGQRPYVEVRRVNSTELEESVPGETRTHNSFKCKNETIDENVQMMRHGKADNGEAIMDLNSSVDESALQTGVAPFILFLFGIHEASVLEGVKQLKLEGVVQVTNNIGNANAVLALQSKLKKNTKIQTAADSQDIPIYVTKMNSSAQITKAIKTLIREHADGFKNFDSKDKIISSQKVDALEEARIGIEQKVIGRGECVELIPRPPYILSLQIDFARKYHLRAEIIGKEIDARVCILPLPIITTPNAAAAVASHSSHSNGITPAMNMLPLLPS